MMPLIILWKYKVAFAQGMIITAELTLIAASFGSFVGAAIELLCRAIGRYIRTFIDVIAFGISAIPPLVVLFWLYYPAQILLHLQISSFWTAAVTLIVLNSFSVYRIFADANADVPSQYIDTARVCGFTSMQCFRYIRVPLLIRSALPRWIDQQVSVLQISVFASLISVDEIFRVAQRINSTIYDPVVIYSAMALVFLLTAGSGLYIARYFRLRLHRNYSEH